MIKSLAQLAPVLIWWGYSDGLGIQRRRAPPQVLVEGCRRSTGQMVLTALALGFGRLDPASTLGAAEERVRRHIELSTIAVFGATRGEYGERDVAARPRKRPQLPAACKRVARSMYCVCCVRARLSAAVGAVIAFEAVAASGCVAFAAADCGVRRGERAVRERGLSVRLVGAVRSLM